MNRFPIVASRQGRKLKGLSQFTLDWTSKHVKLNVKQSFRVSDAVHCSGHNSTGHTNIPKYAASGYMKIFLTTLWCLCVLH